MSGATTSLCPSWSSETVHRSMDSDSRSGHAGTNRSVSSTGQPRSSTANLRAPECIRSTTRACCGGGVTSCCHGTRSCRQCTHISCNIYSRSGHPGTHMQVATLTGGWHSSRVHVKKPTQDQRNTDKANQRKEECRKKQG